MVADTVAAPQKDYTRALLAAVSKLGKMRNKPAPELTHVLGAEPMAVPHSTIAIAVPTPLLSRRDLATRLPVREDVSRRTVAKVHALEDVSFAVAKGQTLALVEE